MQRFETGKIYLEHRRVILEHIVRRYRVDRRTDKTVWITRIEEDGSENTSRRYKVRYYGDVCEYLYGSGPGNPRSVWYSPDLNLFAKDVE